MEQRVISWWGVLVLCLAVAFPAGAANLPDLVPLVKKLQPVVVNISSSQNAKPASRQDKAMPMPHLPKGGESQLDEFFRRFFEQGPDQQPFPSRSLGSGVIIDESGYILTNHHVVDEADEIQVRLSDEREFTATVVGRDAKSDLALIRIKTDGKLPVADLGDSEKAEVGSWVVAIGNPFGLEASVTVGIISARGRSIGNGPYDNFLQTDAAINPGNSGGPLFNLQGEVIGINTAIFSRSGGNMGIGFAIPINMAKSIVAQLRSSGKVTRGWLGVRIQTVTKELAEALGLGAQRGALVASVEPKSPAELAGVVAGDVIVRFDGHEVGRMKELPAVVAETPVNKKVTMEVIRNGAAKTLNVVVATMRDEDGEASEESGQAESSTDRNVMGVSVQPLSAELRARLELPAEANGVVVAAVENGSPAEYAGVRAGDLIQEVNRKPVKTVHDFRAMAAKLEPGQTLLVLVQRGGEPLFMAIQLPAKGQTPAPSVPKKP
ncbi:MAG: DegQ family serine endoprotease [Magnetococcales bacterium]|nr:DegQ family serine endoprotease [Magnetococcales bacterium]